MADAKFDWISVTNTLPCPICSANKWCLIHKDGRKVLCPRVESGTAWTKRGQTNYLHRISNAQHDVIMKNIDQAAKSQAHRKVHDFDRLLTKLLKQDNRNALNALAVKLGECSAQTLSDYQVTWNGFAWCMPMKDGSNVLTGMQQRFPYGDKRFITGSHQGIFTPLGAVPEEVWICEGFSDTACNYSAGFWSIGRVSAKTCYEQTVRFLKHNSTVQYVHIIADDDHDNERDPDCGIKGATTLSFVLSGFIRGRIVMPDGFQDTRSMLNETKEAKFKEIKTF